MQDDDSQRDHELDAALARYAAIEPPAGLEQRLLANLRAEQQLLATRGSRRWLTLAPLALAVSIAVVSASWLIRSKAFNPATRLGGASREDVASDTGPAGAGRSDVRRHGLDSGRLAGHVQSTERAKSAMANPLSAHESPQKVPAEAAPRLERFPAPQPLSEQEKLLVRFVEEDPQEAALVAEAMAEQLQREDEEMKEFGEAVQQER